MRLEILIVQINIDQNQIIILRNVRAEFRYLYISYQLKQCMFVFPKETFVYPSR